MKAVEQFIVDALKGGWVDPFVTEGEHVRHEIMYGIRYPVYAMLLDPKAWQAVGKTRKWGVAPYQASSGVYMTTAQHKMLGLVMSLWNGNSIDAYLERI